MSKMAWLTTKGDLTLEARASPAGAKTVLGSVFISGIPTGGTMGLSLSVRSSNDWISFAALIALDPAPDSRQAAQVQALGASRRGTPTRGRGARTTDVDLTYMPIG